jgi:hypothetical protein
MYVLEHKTILKKSWVINPNTERLMGFVKPDASLGFAIHKQPEEGVLVFSVYLNYTIEYTELCRYIFEGYDGTVITECNPKPLTLALLEIVYEACERIDELFKKELKKNKISFEEDPTARFVEEELLKMLTHEINKNYDT